MRKLNNIAIVFLADATPGACQRALEAGADICLPAPIDPDDFCSALSRLAKDKLPAAPDKAGSLIKMDARKNGLPLKRASMATGQYWRLINGGWVLRTPQGIHLRLTATERELMTHIFTADDKTVYYAQWDRRYRRMARNRRDKVPALSILRLRIPKAPRRFICIQLCQEEEMHDVSQSNP